MPKGKGFAWVHVVEEDSHGPRDVGKKITIFEQLILRPADWEMIIPRAFIVSLLKLK